jgi:hypothetical protein
VVVEVVEVLYDLTEVPWEVEGVEVSLVLLQLLQA